MAKLRELLGENYKEGMTLAEAEKALEGKNLVDLSTGDYVSKAKYPILKRKGQRATAVLFLCCFSGASLRNGAVTYIL